MAEPDETRPLRVFISYSQKDKKLLEQLQVHLTPLKGNADIIVWADTELKPGSKWKDEIQAELAAAHVAVPLVSANFLHSRFIHDVELPAMLNKASDEGMVVIPVIVSSCLFEASELRHYLAANDPARPLDKLRVPERNQQWAEIARKIRDARRKPSPTIPEEAHWEGRQRQLERMVPTTTPPLPLAETGEQGGLLGLLTSFGSAAKAHGPFPAIGRQCVTANLDENNNVMGAATFRIRLREGFPRAFQAIGGASKVATRFLLRFQNIPNGVRVALPGLITSKDKNFAIALLLRADANGNDGVRTNRTGLHELPSSAGATFAVYEVLLVNPLRANTVDVGVVLAWRADLANDLPSAGTMQASACLAPVTTKYPVSAGKFVDIGSNRSVFSIVPCTTVLLFPFATNQSGYDTGIAISNTCRDPWGTPPQKGPVILNYYGSTAGGGAPPSPQVSAPIPAGGQLTFMLSSGNSAVGIAGTPGFQGYIIAVCQFQNAVGYASIRDGFGGAPTHAEGYLAQVIDVGPDFQRNN